MDIKKVLYVQKWTQGIKDQCADDMEDIINPRVDFGQIDWQQSVEHCLIRDAVGDIVNLPRVFLYEPLYNAEQRGDDVKRWLIARFSDDASLLNLFLTHEEEKSIILIAAMRVFALFERMPSSQKTSFLADLFFGLQRLDDKHLGLFSRFLCDDDEGYVRNMRNTLRDYNFSGFEQLISLSFKQQT